MWFLLKGDKLDIWRMDHAMDRKPSMSLYILCYNGVYQFIIKIQSAIIIFHYMVVHWAYSFCSIVAT